MENYLVYNRASETIRQMPQNYLVAHSADEKATSKWICEPDLAADMDMCVKVFKLLLNYDFKYGTGISLIELFYAEEVCGWLGGDYRAITHSNRTHVIDAYRIKYHNPNIVNVQDEDTVSLNIRRMGEIESLVRYQQSELIMDAEYEGSKEDLDISNEIVVKLRLWFGYDWTNDDSAEEYFSHATHSEIWGYYLTSILPVIKALTKYTIKDVVKDTTKYKVLSPDGFNIRGDEDFVFVGMDAVQEGLRIFVTGYANQGYYSSVIDGDRVRIPLDILHSMCKIVEVKN